MNPSEQRYFQVPAGTLLRCESTGVVVRFDCTPEPVHWYDEGPDASGEIRPGYGKRCEYVNKLTVWRLPDAPFDCETFDLTNAGEDIGHGVHTIPTPPPGPRREPK